MFDHEFMKALVQVRMPFGKYQGRYITQLPVHYLEWFHRRGFPNGKLGQYLSTMYEIKINGLMDIIQPIIKEYRKK